MKIPELHNFLTGNKYMEVQRSDTVFLIYIIVINVLLHLIDISFTSLCYIGFRFYNISNFSYNFLESYCIIKTAEKG